MGTEAMAGQIGQARVEVSLDARPERRLIRPAGSKRHVAFTIRVGVNKPTVDRERMPLHVALVLDRSGSMQGEKLVTAKRATLAALDRLDERDQAAVVVFDDRIDVVQAAAPVTVAVKRRLRDELERISARGSTALHEGWLTGCQAIASDVRPDATWSLARCLLLTDGIANVGVVEPERIASEATDLRLRTGISTSAFGIGNDYNESLLAPMAAGGGGQFHHLRSVEDIARSFLGELGELLAVAAARVTLELETGRDVTLEAVSEYRLQAADPGANRYALAIGDLLPGEERHLVVRFGFPAGSLGAYQTIRARLTWMADGPVHSTGWQEVVFSYASQQACDDEPSSEDAMHWIGLHHALRARRQATEQSRDGDLAGARRTLEDVADRVAGYAWRDHELQEAVADLRAYAPVASAAPLQASAAREQTYQAQRRSRGQRDLRSG